MSFKLVSFLRITFFVISLTSSYCVSAQQNKTFSLESRSSADVLYHEKSSSLLVDLYSANQQLSGVFPLSFSQISFLVETERQINRYRTTKNNLDFQIATHQTFLSIFWKLNYQNFFAEPGISLSISDFGKRIGGGSTLGWEFNQDNRIFLSFFNRKSSYYHSWNAEDSHADFNQWSEINELKLSVTYSPFSQIIFNSDIKRRLYTVASESEPFSESSNYEGLTYSAGLNYKATEHQSFSFHFSSFAGRGEPDYQFQNFSFSTFQQGKTSDLNFSMGAFYSAQSPWEIGSEFKYRKLDLLSSGLLQSFPFAAGVISILGDYYFFSMDGKLEIYDFSVSGIYHFSNSQSLTMKSGYQLAEPDLFLQTWEPLFFTVGRKNEQTTQFDYSKVHLIPLSLQWKFAVTPFTFDFQLNQLIPVYTEKRVAAGKSETGSPGDSSPKPKTKSDRTVWGGTSFKLIVGLEI